MIEILARVLAADKSVQGFALAVSVMGLCWSVPLALEAWRDLQSIRGNGSSSLKYLIARQGVRSQMSILFVQMCLFTITAAVLTLPPVPVYEMGTHITSVLALRKMLRLLMTVVLAYQAWMARQTRVRLWAWLEGERWHDAK